MEKTNIIKKIISLTSSIILICSCSTTPSEIVDPSHEHSFSSNWSFDSEYHYHESECNHNVVGDKEKHTFSPWEVIYEQNEELTGLKERSCSTCLYKEEAIIAKDEHVHKYSSWYYDNKHHWKESICNHDVDLEKEEHEFSSWNVTREATNSKDGIRERKCCHCTYKEKEIFTVDGHVHTFDDLHRVDGFVHYRKTTCNHDVKDDTSELHNYDKNYVCTVCKDNPTSPRNKNGVVLGKNKYLYQTGYIHNELGLNHPSRDTFEERISMISSLSEKFKERNKEIYLYITPSKAHHYLEFIPDYYFKDADLENNNYHLLIDTLKKSNLNYFDTREYIERTLVKKLKAPIFYRTANHWSAPYSSACAAELLNRMAKVSKHHISSFDYNEVKIPNPALIDIDLMETANVHTDDYQENQYYYTTEDIHLVDDRPSALARGGSFMNHSIDIILRNGVFHNGMHIENNYVFTNAYATYQPISFNGAYSEINALIDHLKISDIIILEINECAAEEMTWAFIDYMNDHINEFL